MSSIGDRLNHIMQQTGSSQITFAVRVGPYYVPAQCLADETIQFALQAETDEKTARLAASSLAVLQHSQGTHYHDAFYVLANTMSIYRFCGKWYPLIICAKHDPAGSMQILTSQKVHDAAAGCVLFQDLGQPQQDMAIALSLQMAEEAGLPFNKDLGPMLRQVAVSGPEQPTFTQVFGSTFVYFTNS